MDKINFSVKYASPDSLQVTPTIEENYLLLGTCQLGIIAGHAEKIGKHVDHILVNASIALPDLPPNDPTSYRAQIISLTLRDILEEWPWEMVSGYRRFKCITEGDYYKFFIDCSQRIEILLRRFMKFNLSHGLTTLVLNFQTPQRNPLGTLINFYSYSNPVYFIDRLNESLEKATLAYQGAYIINVDRLHSIIGKRFYQDDVLSLISHNSIIDEFNLDRDANRIVPPESTHAMYGVEPHVIGDILWREIDASMRIISRTDAVKIVIFDLDDTLWRGVAADDDLNVYERTEGWPISMVETIRYLKSRGIIIALCSKNDIEFVQRKLNETYGGILDLTDFQSVKCNWDRKDENVAKILKEVNLLPESAVFIDDNPAEIDIVKRSFPKIRTIGSNHYDWKRILLWAPETQVPYITEESRNRASGYSVNIAPENTSADNSIHFDLFSAHKINIESKHYKRFFELLNKTNQFNTTGQRWTQGEVVQLLNEGGEIHVFFARSSLFDAGLVAAVVMIGNVIIQFVMSCRVFGHGIEFSILRNIMDFKGELIINIIDTGKNAVALAFAKRLGFKDGIDNFRVLPGVVDKINCPSVSPLEGN